MEIRRARGKADAIGAVLPGGLEGWVAGLVPWVPVGVFTWSAEFGSRLPGEVPEAAYALPIIVSLFLALVQVGRRSARRQAAGDLATRATRGWLPLPVPLVERSAS